MISFKPVIDTIHWVIVKVIGALKKKRAADSVIDKMIEPLQCLSPAGIGISKEEASIIIMSTVAMSQIQKATLAAGNITYNSNKGPVYPQESQYNRLNGSKVNVNAELVPLSAGMLMMLDIYAKNIQPFPIENKL
jgi:hypothetical protein